MPKFSVTLANLTEQVVVVEAATQQEAEELAIGFWDDKDLTYDVGVVEVHEVRNTCRVCGEEKSLHDSFEYKKGEGKTAIHLCDGCFHDHWQTRCEDCGVYLVDDVGVSLVGERPVFCPKCAKTNLAILVGKVEREIRLAQ